MRISIDLTPDQIDEIASAVAAKVAGKTAEVLTLEEAAEAAKVCKATMRNWVKAGRLRRVPGSRHYLIPRADLERILSQ